MRQLDATAADKMVIMTCNTSSALALKRCDEFLFANSGVITQDREQQCGKVSGCDCHPSYCCQRNATGAILEIDAFVRSQQVGCQVCATREQRPHQ